MPYIDKQIRETIKTGEYVPMTAGELNFQFTACIKNYIEINNLNYQTINDIIGALEGAKLEFYRRIAAPYEDTKIEQNGDVW